MKIIKLVLALIPFMLFGFIKVNGQDYEKMNRKELRAAVEQFQNNVDSLQKELLTLNQSKENLRQELEILKTSAEVNSKKLTGTQELLALTEKKIDALKIKIETQQQQISVLTVEKKNYADSISKLKETIANLEKNASSNNQENKDVNNDQEKNSENESNNNVGSANSPCLVENKSNPNDFLNKYFSTLPPLTNNKFSFTLSKIIMGDVNYKNRSNRYYNNSEEENNNLLTLPEILNASDFSFWSSKYSEFTDPTNNRDELKAASVLEMKGQDFLNNKMPTFEVLRNKLFTMQFKSGYKEESFLFNVNKMGKNNLRAKAVIKLANEEVKADGENSKARDIIWEIINIGDESYIALTQDQIKRLNVPLSNWGEDSDNTRSYERKGGKYVNNRYVYQYEINMDKFYLSRNKDKFMDGGYFVNPSDCIFLFKINPL